jgi:predicted dehydrogenase
MNRRQMLQNLSMTVTAGSLPAAFARNAYAQASEPQKPVSPNSRITLGVVGPGSRGLELIRQFLRVPGVELAATCDVYEPRFDQVDDLAGTKVRHYKDYREMLANKSIDAIVVATPPVFHGPQVLAALESGRPVYGEKTLAFTPDECNRVAAAVARHKQIFQIGHQYRYASWYKKAIERVHAGEIGEPTHVYGYWHRSDNWRRPCPDPALEHLFNWRLYRETSGGLFEELGSHHVEVANWVFGEHPESVTGTSSIVAYNDGRTVGDNVQAEVRYSRGRRLVFSSLSTNSMMGDQLWIYGTEGSVQLTLADATFFGEKRRDAPKPAHSDVSRGLATGSSYKTAFAMPYRGPGDRIEMEAGEDPTRTACGEFIRSVRSGEPVVADIRVAYGTAMTVAAGRSGIREDAGARIPRMQTAS